MEKTIFVRDIKIGGKPFVFIAGPCVIEGRDITLRIAEKLKDITERLKIPFIFKASYDKANRTSIKSYRGPGIKEGLKILQEVKEKLDVPVLSDVHSVYEVDEAKDVLDILQIPAFLCRQTDLALACGRTKKVVNVKKGQFLSPFEMIHIIEKIRSTGNENIILTERGTFFGYNMLVNDFRAIPIMKGFGYPVVFDATHSIQRPAGRGESSSGDREFVFPLARAAVAVGVDGIFMEVHEDPCSALCDGENSLPLFELEGILKVLKRIEEAI